MTFISFILIISGLIGLCWNIYKHPENRIDGSSISLLLCFFVGIALLFEPERVTLPFIDIKEKANQEYKEIQDIKKASKEILAIQLWNSSQLPNEKTKKNKYQRAIKIFESLYGTKYKHIIKILSEENKLLMTEEEKRNFNFDSLEPASILPYSKKLNNEASEKN